MRSLVSLLVIVWNLPVLLASPQLPGEPRVINATSAAAPVPSMKYKLMPMATELVPGNAATFYYRSYSVFAEASPNFLDLFRGILKKDDKGEEYYQVEKWLDMPLKDMPQKEVENHLNIFKNNFLREAELAALRQHCDWELHGRPEGLLLLLPDLQAYRSLGRIVQLKARLQLARGEYEQALQTLKLNFVLARDLCRGPTVIHTLVGNAIANISLNELETLIQVSQTPNLYWALTTLPHPYTDLRDALDHEVDNVFAMLPSLREMEKGPASDELIAALKADKNAFRNKLGVTKGFPEPIMVGGMLADAKKSLLAGGMRPEVLAKMPNQQIVIVDAMRRHRVAHEELRKWLELSYPQARLHMAKELPAFQESCARLDVLLYDTVLEKLGIYSGWDKAWVAGIRLDRRIAALLALEAIRMQAAADQGKLPKQLSDVKVVPVPLDPMTGVAFQYKVDGNQATLYGPTPPGEEKYKHLSITYVLNLQGK